MEADKVDAKYKRMRLQVFLGIFIGYAGFYIVRKNFSMAIPELALLGFDQSELSIVLAMNAVAYALSKFLMGSVSDRSNARVFLPLGLVLAALSMMFMIVPVTLLGPEHKRLAIFIMAVLNFLVGWFIGTYLFPAVVAIFIAILAYVLIRDTPQSCSLPSVEKWRNDYPKNYSAKQEEVLTTREIFFKYVLNNKLLWFIAIANAFVYMVRYGCLDWAPTYLRDAQGYDIKQAGWAYFAYEFAAIPGTLICGWLSDKVFHGRRAVPTILFMAIVAVFIFLYWQFSSNYFIVTMSLIAIGFFIYGPVMLIGVQALDLAPKNAAGTAAGLTGFFGYFLGTAILANIVIGSVAEAAGWDWTFILLIAACFLSIVFMAFTYKGEKEILGQK